MANLDGGGRVAGRAGAADLVDHAPHGIPIDTARCEGNDHVIQHSHESPFVPRRRRRAPGHPAVATLTGGALADPASADTLPDYAPIPPSALGPALNEQGYFVGRVEKNLYWVTDGTYQA